MSEEEAIYDAAWYRTESEELVNTITHGAGTALSLVGGTALVFCAAAGGSVWRAVGCAMYAATLIGVYTFSTLSHAVPAARPKQLFRALDQAFIYLLIAGTYTPFALAFLRRGWWWVLFIVIWSGALLGFCSKLRPANHDAPAPVWLYVLMGWLPILSAGALQDHLPAIALWLMLIGGLCYTLGTIFLVADKRQYHFHALWHVAVIAGSMFHFFPILFFVAMGR